MINQIEDTQCWYKIVNDKFKVDSAQVLKYGINIDKCVECKFSITSESYQQNSCGSRYCADCFSKLKAKYYCAICKEEDTSNYVHKRENIFLDKAMIKDLEKLHIKCPDCNTEIKLIDLEKHVLQKCEKGWKFCNKCQSMYKMKSFHNCQKSSSPVTSLKKLCEDCGKECMDENHKCNINWEKSCPYGCNVKVSELRKHKSEASLNHLDKCYSILKELDLDTLDTDQESSKCPAWLRYTVAQMESQFDCHPRNVKTLIDDVDSMNKEIVEEKNINEIIRDNMFTQMTELQHTSFDGTITWRIDNFSKVKKDAIDGTQKSVFSPPFYSSRFGYKMCLRLYPNGDSLAVGVAMSLFLVIMKGRYDDILKWPFKQKVTFILVDPEFKTNWIDAFIPSENMSSFAQPRTDMNIPSGSSYFIKFEDMNLNPLKYAKNNVVFIRCIVDCSDLTP